MFPEVLPKIFKIWKVQANIVILLPFEEKALLMSKSDN